MLVLQQINVDTHAEIGGSGLIRDIGGFVGVVIGLADTKFHDGKPLVVQIDAQASSYLATIAEHQTGRTNEVERHLKTSEQRNGILLHAEHFQLRMGCGRCHEQDKTNSEP